MYLRRFCRKALSGASFSVCKITLILITPNCEVLCFMSTALSYIMRKMGDIKFQYGHTCILFFSTESAVKKSFREQISKCVFLYRGFVFSGKKNYSEYICAHTGI